jgi:hypothetical protein
MASSPACSLVTGGTSTAYTVTTNQNNSGGAHGICGAGTVPNNPDDRGDAEQHQRPLRKLAWERVASSAIVGVLIMRPASSVGVTSFLICLRRAFAIGPWRTAILVDELNAGGSDADPESHSIRRVETQSIRDVARGSIARRSHQATSSPWRWTSRW